MTAKRQWVLLTALLCLAVLAAGFLLLVKPQHSKASSIKTETAGVQSQVEQLEAKLALLTQEKKDITGEQAKLAQYVRQLPPDPEEPTLLRKVQEAATKAEVDLQTLNPSAPTAYSPNGGAAVAGLEVIPVSMTISGDYFQTEEFLDALEGLQRSMLVDTFAISGTSGSTSATGSTSESTTPADVTVSIAASVFMSTSIGQTPASAPTPAAGATAGSAS
jgi:Tfp pilus assembly protein PilO